MALESVRPFPVRVRPLHLEAPECYGRRLALANGLPEDSSTKAARQIAGSSGAQATRAALVQWCESRGALREGHFGRQTDREGEGMPERTMCRLCSQGQTIEQIDHAESHCCLRHGLWTSPGTTPDAQVRVDGSVLKAEVRYRRLRRAGRAATSLIRELAVIVNRHQGMHGVDSHLGPRNYSSVVDLARLLTNQSFQRQLLAPSGTFAQAHRILQTAVIAGLPSADAVIVDGLWRLLRPAFLAVRHSVEGQDHPGFALCSLLGINPGGFNGAEAVSRPLEPFSRYLGVLQSSLADRWANSCELALAAGQHVRPRAAATQGSWTATFICSRGHSSQRTLNTSYTALKHGRDGCPYCAGLRPLAGFNSMAESHPRLAAEWHPTLNGATTPSDVSGAGNSADYWWTCGHGHEWRATPNNRAKGQGCPYCSGRRCLPGSNTLDVTHPQIAAEWNQRGNTSVAPSDVTAGSGLVVEWICYKGHEYRTTPDARTSRGSGCPVCANLRVLIGINDLATTHADIAAEWHPSLNGSMNPQTVVGGSGKKCYWRCPKGHDYSARINSRTKGRGCPVCAGQQVLVGYNDLSTTHPGLVVEWDQDKNGNVTPQHVIAGSARIAHWVCSLGHRYSKPINKRAKGSACQYCSNRKVLGGFNDLATRHPSISLDWHPEKNGPLTPSDVVPGNTKRWWRCRRGHEQLGTVPNRIKTGGCSICTLEERVQ